MPKAHIRKGKLRIPLSDEIRAKLDLQDGDELEAHVFPGSIVLRTITPDVRERAWERILSIIDQVHPSEEQAAKPIAQVEEEIAEYVKETRRAHRARRPHG